jgi:uncharacterized protein (DUF1800 family)
MPRDLEQVDPKWAWDTYQPDSQYPWTRRSAAHLFRRAGYGANSGELDEAVRIGPAASIDKLLTADQTAGSFQQEMDSFAKTTLATGNAKKLSSWWLYRALHAPDQLHDKVTLFWHGHFAASAAKVQDANVMYKQHTMLRELALGEFVKLAHAISRDPAMLIYLDSATNRKRHPNENFARELMELFCLGTGNYTEQDIREIARCFTGWEVRRRKFTFNKYQHDKGEKSFLSRSGTFGGEDAVDVVVDHPAAANFIAGKLVRFFVFDDSEIPAALLKPLADDFRKHDLNIRHLVDRILRSRLLHSEYSYGRKIRSPVELGLGLLRALEGSANTIRLVEEMESLGQALFFPPSVKGWDGGRAWINSSTLLGRANMVGRIVRDEEARFAGGQLSDLAKKHAVASANEIVDWLTELLIAVPIADDVREQLIDTARQAKDNPNKQMTEVIHMIGTLPEFQLG